MLIAAAVFTLGSCARIETNDGPGTTKAPAIGFSSYTPKSLTKADGTYVSGTALADNKEFAVYAWRTEHDEFLAVNPGAPGFMNPAVVTWKGDDGSGSANTYSPPRYWPAGDEPDNLSFVAYYPYGAAGITAPTFVDGDSNPSGVGTYAFVAQGTPAEMVDFCVADVVNDQTYGHTNKTSQNHKGTVNFSFKHMLTRVQFKFKKSGGLENTTVVELVDAELSGIKNSGTLKATFAQHKEDADNNPATPDVVVTGVNKIGTTSTAWSGQSGSAGYEITVNKADPESGSEIVLTETASTVDDKDVFLMVPQDMAANTQAIKVTWKVKIYDSAANATANSGSGLLSETTNTRTLYFYSDLVMETYDHDNDPDTPPIAYPKDWIKNNSITYTITIGPNPIYFTGTVTNWAAEQNGYFNP